MNIMKQAGYRTYWITNQQTLTKRNTMLTNFSEQMESRSTSITNVRRIPTVLTARCLSR